MINLTIKEKNDLSEVYDCLLMQNQLEAVLCNVYKGIFKFVKKVKSSLRR
ncbi:MAG: hypothetical protein R3331_05760 [Sulfurospirillaceae bacterium]|nr:hypothetical protein [Sulfurospirillaceae bacterium]